MTTITVQELIPILQVAIGPVVLISGVGLLILLLTKRLGRVIDRGRSLVREMPDTVRLETDHGPVAVNLDSDSALSLQTRSNSGEVACLLPGIDSSIRMCDGEFNSGGGELTIRTVSGAVTLQVIP